MPESNKEMIHALVEDIWNRKAVNTIERHVSLDYVGRNPDGDVHGPAGYRKIYDTYAGAFPDCHIKIQEVVSEGTMVACHYHFSGTHKGELAGVAPTGKRVAVHGLAILRFEGGQLVEDRTIWDTLRLMQQVGAS